MEEADDARRTALAFMTYLDSDALGHRNKKRSASYQFMHAEPVIFIGPNAFRLPTCSHRQISKFGYGIFVGIFSVNTLAFAEVKRPPANTNILSTGTHKVHLDATGFRIIDGTMLKREQIKSAAELTVDTRQQIQIKGSRNTGVIVISARERLLVLLQIDPDDQPTGFSQNALEAREQTLRLGGR